MTLGFIDQELPRAADFKVLPMLVGKVRAPFQEFSRSNAESRTRTLLSPPPARLRRRRSLKELLLAPEARTDELVPPRETYTLDPPPNLD